MFKGNALTNVSVLQFHIALNPFEQHNLFLYCTLIESPARDSSDIRAIYHMLVIASIVSKGRLTCMQIMGALVYMHPFMLHLTSCHRPLFNVAVHCTSLSTICICFQLHCTFPRLHIYNTN